MKTHVFSSCICFNYVYANLVHWVVSAGVSNDEREEKTIQKSGETRPDKQHPDRLRQDRRHQIDRTRPAESRQQASRQTNSPTVGSNS